MSGPAGPARDDDVERAFMLRDVMEHVVEASQQPAPRHKSRTRGIVAIVVCVLLLGASAWSWIARPEQIWGPSGAPASPVIDRASARLSIAMIAQRLQDERARTGSYPPTLRDLGELAAEIDYEVFSDTLFELRTTASGEPIEYRSDQSLEEFVGRSATLISQAK